MPCSACPCGTRAAIRVLLERGPLLDHDRQKVVCAAVTVSTDTVRLLGLPTSLSGAYGTEENTASIHVRCAGAVSSIPEPWLSGCNWLMTSSAFWSEPSVFSLRNRM
jgi:hypothetical protein